MMKLLNNALKGKNPNVLLSIMWVFILMNMIYADIFNTLKPGYLDELEYVSTHLSDKVILLFAIFMQVPIVMIPLSRMLDRVPNRIAHFITIPLSILWIIIPALFTADTPLSYMFFATIEVSSLLGILYYVWYWEDEIVEMNSCA